MYNPPFKNTPTGKITATTDTLYHRGEIMSKHVEELAQYWQYKILAGVWSALYSDDVVILFLLLVGLQLIDIFTRWLAQSYHCFKAIYPQTPCNLYRAWTFMWQARRWRYIRSTGLRDGFCDKMITYLLLLLLAITADAALEIGKLPRVLISTVSGVLVLTETLSVLENLSECGVQAIGQIKDKITGKLTAGGK